MRILFDQSIPKNLAKTLDQHEVLRAFEMGWSELQNGDLIDAAEQAGFDLFLTSDKNIRYQQNLTQRKIPILLTSTNHWPTMRLHTDAIVQAIELVEPSSFSEVDCGNFQAGKR